MNFNDKHTSNGASQPQPQPQARRSSATQIRTQPRRANVAGTTPRKATDSRTSAASRSQQNTRSGASRSNKPAEKDTRDQRRGQARGQDLMRYAQDSPFVQKFYALVTGPYKVAFYSCFIAICLFAMYFPVRDMYIAMRTQQDLLVLMQTQVDENNEAQSKVDSLMSQEGIEDIAREELGLVMPGETVGVVVGVDEEGNPLPENEGESGGTQSDGTSDPNFDLTLPFGPNATDEEQHQAEEQATGKPLNPLESDVHPVLGDLDQDLEGKEKDQVAKKYAPVPWYYAVGDFIFGYHGATGETIVSTGTHSVDK